MFFFSKMQATGNDFIVINNCDNSLEYNFKLLSQFLCNRHFGVGADGILIIENGLKTKFRMRIFNQDGTEAEMCGNGIRCIGKYLYEKNLITDKEFFIETKAGIKKLKLEIERSTVIAVEVDMGIPIFEFDKIPVYCCDETRKTGKLIIENNIIYPISIGNPHSVCFVEDVEKVDIENDGTLIENYKYFPNKTNVEFVQIIRNDYIKVRVWERGVGETFSCGTGACAASIISSIEKSTKGELIVELRGGKLNVCYKNEHIFLRGNSEFVFDGEIKI